MVKSGRYRKWSEMADIISAILKLAKTGKYRKRPKAADITENGRCKDHMGLYNNGRRTLSAYFSNWLQIQH